MNAFCVYGQDNDSYAFREYPQLTDNQRIHQEVLPDMSGKTNSGLHRCEACGDLLNKWEEPLSGLVVKKRKLDIGSTYDGVTIVSQRFKSVYEERDLSGLEFRQLPDDPDFHSIRAVRAVGFDAKRRRTRYINPCPKCGRFESVVGATPVYLKEGVEIGQREFVRTDLEFGSNDEKHSLLLCGEDAEDILNSTDLKGLDLIAIEQPVSSG